MRVLTPGGLTTYIASQFEFRHPVAEEVAAMTQSLTDWLQQTRLIVVAVDPERRRVRVKSDGDACTDLSCGADARRQRRGDRPGPRRAEPR